MHANIQRKLSFFIYLFFLKPFLPFPETLKRDNTTSNNNFFSSSSFEIRLISNQVEISILAVQIHKLYADILWTIVLYWTTCYDRNFFIFFLFFFLQIIGRKTNKRYTFLNAALTGLPSSERYTYSRIHWTLIVGISEVITKLKSHDRVKCPFSMNTVKYYYYVIRCKFKVVASGWRAQNTVRNRFFSNRKLHDTTRVRYIC